MSGGAYCYHSHDGTFLRMEFSHEFPSEPDAAFLDLFSGVLAPFHPQPGERGRETRDRRGEIGAFRSERAARVSDTGFSWLEAC